MAFLVQLSMIIIIIATFGFTAAFTYVACWVSTEFIVALLIGINNAGIGFNPSLDAFIYDGGYDHLDAPALADRPKKGAELPEGKYEEDIINNVCCGCGATLIAPNTFAL